MAVEARWLSMGGPAGVGNTAKLLRWLGEVLVLGLFVDQLAELLDLSDLLAGENLLLPALLDYKTSGIISTVLEKLQFCQTS